MHTPGPPGPPGSMIQTLVTDAMWALTSRLGHLLLAFCLLLALSIDSELRDNMRPTLMMRATRKGRRVHAPQGEALPNGRSQ